MRKHKPKLTRLGTAGIAAMFVAAFSLTALTNLVLHVAPVSANGQVTSRKITMTNSSPGGSATYHVSFIPTVTTTLGGIVVDFCANDPVVGDTSCTFPTSFTLGTTVSVTNIAGIGVGGSWVTTSSLQCGAAASNFQVLFLTNATPQAPTGGATPITFDINTVTNPSTNGSFYARIVTFDTNAHATGQYTCPTGTTRQASFANQIDYGGIALSTTQNILITAKVFETLSFCVYQTSCGTQANLTLGDPTTGALSSTTAYVNNNAKYTLATNAQSGVKVNMFGLTLCRASSLTLANCPASPTSSANTITGIGTSAVVSTTNSEQFGMCVNAISGTTAQSPYDDPGTGNSCSTGISTGTYAGTSKFAFDDTAATGTNSSTGSLVLSSSGAVNSGNSQFAFLGNIASTTEAGIYTTSLNLVATGTF
ncbi:MAG TPA: hypothetical protein VFH37_00345 [Candidatus Saccharimonadales bacterium]|nr:hypothetical protein [Candidatus Saccharimonadales bacterium]